MSGVAVVELTTEYVAPVPHAGLVHIEPATPRFELPVSNTRGSDCTGSPMLASTKYVM